MSLFTGKAKVLFVKRLGSDWRHLADFLEIPPHQQRAFPPGDEARHIWEWLENRDGIDALTDALGEIDRSDLADALVAVSADSGAGASSVPNQRPEPAYSDDHTRELAGRLHEAQSQRRDLVIAGQDTAEMDARILGLKRELREGGRLKAGDFLCEGRFELIEVVGQGGFATVWKAYDDSRQELVAVKVLHGQFGEGSQRRERFFRGARKMAALQHPGIVRVLAEELEDGGHYFFVMEYLSGGDLREAVLAGRVSREAAWRVILEVGEALHFAHDRGLIHRDVKPANILLDGGGRSRLTDFDLVRGFDTTGGTRAGGLGTVGYAAPELLADAKTASEPADVYGLGMTAVFVLYGKDLPVDQAMFEHQALVDGLALPERVAGVLRRAVARKIEERFKSAGEFIETLFVGALRTELANASVVPIPQKPEVMSRPVPQRPPSKDKVTSDVVERDFFTPLGKWIGLAGMTVLGGMIALGIGMNWVEEWISPDSLVLQPGDVFRDPFLDGSGQGPEMVVLRSGMFLMGSPEDEPGRANDESPQHEVHVQSFAMGVTEVTFDEYDAFAGATGRDLPSDRGWGRGKRPVINVKWQDAVAYTDWLSEQTGEQYRLPTEAEWEYAARAETTTPFWTGQCIHTDRANYDGNYDLNDCGADTGVYRARTVEVGSLLSNPWGLHETAGNVREWVQDCWHDNYEGAPTDGSAWEEPSCARRVVRGGGWFNIPAAVRSANRNGFAPGSALNFTGFRLARPL